eukprot:augustus_masked-scaffold_40-processed-gene-2.49-mRNA-1 protein AED:1.00 eAED:1.00 QI:0/0/0/0/1/1/2/0/1547
MKSVQKSVRLSDDNSTEHGLSEFSKKSSGSSFLNSQESTSQESSLSSFSKSEDLEVKKDLIDKEVVIKQLSEHIQSLKQSEEEKIQQLLEKESEISELKNLLVKKDTRENDHVQKLDDFISNEVETLKNENIKLKQSLEEKTQRESELSERLQNFIEENHELVKKLQETEIELQKNKDLVNKKNELQEFFSSNSKSKNSLQEHSQQKTLLEKLDQEDILENEVDNSAHSNNKLTDHDSSQNHVSEETHSIEKLLEENFHLKEQLKKTKAGAKIFTAAQIQDPTSNQKLQMEKDVLEEKFNELILWKAQARDLLSKKGMIEVHEELLNCQMVIQENNLKINKLIQKNVELEEKLKNDSSRKLYENKIVETEPSKILSKAANSEFEKTNVETVLEDINTGMLNSCSHEAQTELECSTVIRNKEELGHENSCKMICLLRNSFIHLLQKHIEIKKKLSFGTGNENANKISDIGHSISGEVVTLLFRAQQANERLTSYVEKLKTEIYTLSQQLMESVPVDAYNALKKKMISMSRSQICLELNRQECIELRRRLDDANASCAEKEMICVSLQNRINLHLEEKFPQDNADHLIASLRGKNAELKSLLKSKENSVLSLTEELGVQKDGVDSLKEDLQKLAVSVTRPLFEKESEDRKDIFPMIMHAPPASKELEVVLQQNKYLLALLEEKSSVSAEIVLRLNYNERINQNSQQGVKSLIEKNRACIIKFEEDELVKLFLKESEILRKNLVSENLNQRKALFEYKESNQELSSKVRCLQFAQDSHLSIISELKAIVSSEADEELWCKQRVSLSKKLHQVQLYTKEQGLIVIKLEHELVKARNKIKYLINLQKDLEASKGRHLFENQPIKQLEEFSSDCKTESKHNFVHKSTSPVGFSSSARLTPRRKQMESREKKFFEDDKENVHKVSALLKLLKGKEREVSKLKESMATLREENNFKLVKFNDQIYEMNKDKIEGLHSENNSGECCFDGRKKNKDSIEVLRLRQKLKKTKADLKKALNEKKIQEINHRKLKNHCSESKEQEKVNTAVEAYFGEDNKENNREQENDLRKTKLRCQKLSNQLRTLKIKYNTLRVNNGEIEPQESGIKQEKKILMLRKQVKKFQERLFTLQKENKHLSNIQHAENKRRVNLVDSEVEKEYKLKLWKQKKHYEELLKKSREIKRDAVETPKEASVKSRKITQTGENESINLLQKIEELQHRNYRLKSDAFKKKRNNDKLKADLANMKLDAQNISEKSSSIGTVGSSIMNSTLTGNEEFEFMHELRNKIRKLKADLEKEQRKVKKLLNERKGLLSNVQDNELVFDMMQKRMYEIRDFNSTVLLHSKMVFKVIQSKDLEELAVIQIKGRTEETLTSRLKRLLRKEIEASTNTQLVTSKSMVFRENLFHLISGLKNLSIGLFKTMNCLKRQISSLEEGKRKCIQPEVLQEIQTKEKRNVEKLIDLEDLNGTLKTKLEIQVKENMKLKKKLEREVVSRGNESELKERIRNLKSVKDEAESQIADLERERDRLQTELTEARQQAKKLSKDLEAFDPVLFPCIICV